MGKLKAYFEITRPINSLMVGLAIIIGAFLTGGLEVTHEYVKLFLAFVSGFTLTGAAMAVNDYYDREIDSINEPKRPIPSGRLKPVEALILTGLFSLLGIAASSLISYLALVVAFLGWLIMMSYSAWGKQTGFAGNLMVSTCIGLPFLYGGVLSGSVWGSLFFSLLAFLSNTGREITKGIVDIEGDEAAGIRTIAVQMGQRVASVFAAIFYISAVISSVFPIYFNLVSIWYIPFVLITDIGLVYISICLLREPSRENSRRVKNQVLLFMLIGLFGFAAGSLL